MLQGTPIFLLKVGGWGIAELAEQVFANDLL